MSVKYPWRNEERLRDLYKRQDMTQQEVANKWDCSRTTVRTWLEKHGIEKHDHDDLVSRALTEYYDDRYPWHSEELLRKLYVQDGMSQNEIAEELGCGNGTISRWMDRHDIDSRSRSESVHMAVGTGTNGVSLYTDDMGYERISEHTLDEYERVHRLVVFAHTNISFDELSEKHIHHENNIPWDNRIENLTVMSPSEHTKEHHG